MTRLLALVLLIGCPVEEPPPETPPPTREPCADTNPERNLYWGDLHVHTAWSFDAFFEDVRLTPDDAYAFARGAEVNVTPAGPDGEGTSPVRIDRPLDFAAVTDHAEFLGEILGCSDPDSPVYDGEFCASARADGTVGTQRFGTQNTFEDPTRFEELCGDAGFDCLAAARDVWTRIQDAAEAAYDRTAACTFTSFVGYEWSGTTGVTNLHRNVLFANRTVPTLPTSYYEAPTARQLWTALEAGCLDAGTGCDALSIPHNSNLSNGQMFTVTLPFGNDRVGPLRQQQRVEPLMEIYQHKGASECFDEYGGILSGVDEQCAFEQIRPPPVDDCGDDTSSGGMIGVGCASRKDGLRGALLEGLAWEQSDGVNPLKLGVIASTDTHLGTPGLVAEDNFLGHTGAPEDSREERLARPGLRPVGLLTSPGGLAAVWAESNDREALFGALKRREVYGTSGPRLAVRFFGGDLPDDLCERGDFVAAADGAGVPMGGTLPSRSDPPTFAVSAFKDADGTDLERVQIVKAWIDEAGQHTAVYDLAEAPGGAVDPDTCTRSGSGAASLCATWEDPDFDPAIPATWYARVLEAPSCRWSTHQCLELPEAERPPGCSDPDVQPVIQERAWTSPIWYSP